VFSLSNDFLPKLIYAQEVYGFIDNCYFVDIGTLEGYRKLESDLRSGKISILE